MMKQKLDLVWVDVYPEGDGMKGLYLDGKLLVGGNEYHDDIGSHLKGVLLGLHTMGWDGKYNRFMAEGHYGEKFIEDFGAMPDELFDFDLDVMSYEKEKFKR